MNAQRAQQLDKQIMASNRKEADQLVASMVDVIMQNKWLASQVAHRWAKQYGFQFYNMEAIEAMTEELLAAKVVVAG